MTKTFEIAGVPTQLMNKVGLSVEKIYLKSISENVKDENKVEQIKILLECVKNNEMHLGKNTRDMQEFIYQIYDAYEELKKQNNSAEINNFITCLLEVYYHKGLGEASSNRIGEVKNPQINKIILDYSLTPNFCSDANMAMRIFEEYHDVYETITINPDFYKRLISYLPKKYQKNFNPANIRSMWDINEIVLGTKLPNIEELAEEKLNRVNPVIKFYIIYARYLTMVGFRKKDESQELWDKFYGKKEKEDSNNTISKVVQENKIAEQIIKLMKTKNATAEQVRILACIYGVNIDGLLKYVEEQER